MKNKIIEEKIRQAFSNSVPDVFDEILSKSEKQKGRVILMTEERKTNLWFRWAASVAAVFVLLVAGVFGSFYLNQNIFVASTVSLDVNPGIEIKVNQRDKILAVTPINADGKIILGEMNFKGSTLDVAINAIIGSMLRNDYLNERTNSILISVQNNDPEKGARLQEHLTQEVNSLLQTKTFKGAVLSQTIQGKGDLQKLAETYGITMGKAELIQKIAEHNPNYQFSDLVSLTINELNLLLNKEQYQLGTIERVGQASDKAYIGIEAAKEIAFTHAGVTPSEVTSIKIEMDWEKGMMIYEVEFKSNGFEYDYDIDAKSGEILKFEKEKESQKPESTQPKPTEQVKPTESQVYIGEHKAIQIALAHAGLSQGDVTRLQVEIEREHGVWIYEVEFRYGGYEYEYEINAMTGEIINIEKDQHAEKSKDQNEGKGDHHEELPKDHDDHEEHEDHEHHP